MKKYITQIWIKQSFNDILLIWKDYLILFRNNFLLIPSTMLIFGYLLGFINELNRETIDYYYIPFVLFSSFINALLLILTIYLPITVPYISKGIDIREGEDSKVTYIYFLKLRFGSYTIEEKENYIDIVKHDGTYSAHTKRN